MGIKVGLLEDAVTVSVWFSFVAPEFIPVKFTVCWPASSLMLKPFRASIPGGSFTAFTVTVNVRVTILFEVPPSFTVTVMVDTPEAFATGAKVKLPVAFGLV